MEPRKLTAIELAQRQKVPRKHGIHAINARGENAMNTPQHSRFQELKDLLATEPGRDEYRVQLSAMLALIVELGMSELQKERDKGGNIYASPVIKILNAYQNSLARMLDSWPKDKNRPLDITELLNKAGENGKD